jgi:WD40 repeat protein
MPSTTVIGPGWSRSARLLLALSFLPCLASSALAQQPQHSLEGHQDGVTAVSFSPDGKQLVSGSSDKTLVFWDLATGREIAGFRAHETALSDVAYSPDGKVIASTCSAAFLGKPGQLVLWEATGDKLRTRHAFKPEVFAFWCVAFSPDGKFVAAGYHESRIKIWDVATHKEYATLEGHAIAVMDLVFSSDGKTLFSASVDGTIKVWDVATAKETASLKNDFLVRSLALSPDNKTLAAGGGKYDRQADKWTVGAVALWDIPTRKVRSTLEVQAVPINCVGFTPDSRTLISGSGSKVEGKDIVAGEVQFWDATSGKSRATIKHSGGVSCLALSPDGTRLVVGSFDRSIKVWEIARLRME